MQEKHTLGSLGAEISYSFDIGINICVRWTDKPQLLASGIDARSIM